MTKRFKVREGNTGILYLTDEVGKQERFIPDYDLDKARALLLEFQETRDFNGKRLKDNYWREEHNWYPAMVSYLYWHVFFRYVKYKALIEQVIDGRISLEFENKADLHHLVGVIEGNEKENRLKMIIFRVLVRINNWLVLRLYRFELMFFRFSVEDFRSVEIRKALDELGASYIQVVPPGRIIGILKGMLQRMPYYYYGGVTSNERFNHQYVFGGLDRHKNRLFERAAERIDIMISSYVKEYKIHLRRLKSVRVRTFYGFDDCNGYVFPMLYACRRSGIKTVGHQHGAYVRRHAGYVMEGIEQGTYEWFDKVIVWGEYWKQHLLRNSNVYSAEMLVVGSNKVRRDYLIDTRANGKPQNILVPYEFTTNTFKVGRYITKLIDLGYVIFFKPRGDEGLEDQLAAYCLAPEYLARLHIVNEIDAELIKNVDIVAGTMTTLVYELLPYSKIIWIFDTEYRHLEDLVEDGLAHKVRYEDLEKLDEKHFVRTKIDTQSFFDTESLKETLRKNVLPVDS